MRPSFRSVMARPLTPVDATATDDIVSVSLPSLLGLHHAAESITLKPGRIRSGSSGSYLSPFKGRGMEFDEVRPYMQGDDVRTLDWRVTARTGRAHTKMFREERERAVLLWIDLRRPMFFATRGAFKSVRAAQAAAILGWCAVHQGDRLGAMIFSEQDHVELRPKRGTPPLLHFLKQVSAHPAWHAGKTADNPKALNQSLARMGAVVQPGSLIVLLSDFSGIDAQSEAHLAHLARHNELILIDIHDPLEVELPPSGNYRVSDGENFLGVATADIALRTRYHEAYEQQRADLQALCHRHHMTLLPMMTGEDPQDVLQRFLGARR
jgi:uncharacterized protein (DUF58 family)